MVASSSIYMPPIKNSPQPLPVERGPNCGVNMKGRTLSPLPPLSPPALLASLSRKTRQAPCGTPGGFGERQDFWRDLISLLRADFPRQPLQAMHSPTIHYEHPRALKAEAGHQGSERLLPRGQPRQLARDRRGLPGPVAPKLAVAQPSKWQRGQGRRGKVCLSQPQSWTPSPGAHSDIPRATLLPQVRALG